MNTKYSLMADKIKNAVSVTMPGSTQHMFTEANAVADVNHNNDRSHYTSAIADKFKRDGLNLDETYAAGILDSTYYFCALRNIMSDKDVSLLDMSFILNAEPNLVGQNLAMTSCLSDEFKAKIDGFFDISTDEMCDTLKRYSDCNFV